MITLIGYLLVFVGIGASTIGYVGMRYPKIYKDEARQAFWGAFGTYVFLLGGIAAICGLLLIE